jgi:hypothetical protein
MNIVERAISFVDGWQIGNSPELILDDQYSVNEVLVASDQLMQSKWLKSWHRRLNKWVLVFDEDRLSGEVECYGGDSA